ncbi:hypothetical protein EQH57_0246, partial [Dictyocoela roeselum]
NKQRSLRVSLYNFLLHTGRVPRGHDKLSLTRKEDRLSNANRKYMEPNRATFTLKPPGTTLQIQRTIPLLEDIKRQDIFSWKDEIYETATLAKWDELTTIQVIKSISATDIQPLFSDCETLQDIFKAILKRKYPAGDALKYMTTLSTLKQNNFATIEEYKDEIEYHCKRLITCLEGDAASMNAKICETFYNGLSERTKLEMARLNIQDINQMYQIILTTEKTMLEQSREVNEDPKGKINNKSNTHKKERRTKWCDYHQVSTHNTDECRARKENRSKSENNKDMPPRLIHLLFLVIILSHSQ